MPKVSVIVPVHNPGKYLKPLLESLINQTLKDIEILLIDDGSTDGSRDILKEYEKIDNRIQVFFREQQSYECFGEKYSVDLGKEQAKGNYVIIVDHDDELTLDALEILYSYTNNNTVDVVQGRNISLNEEGKEVYRTDDNFHFPTIIISNNHLQNLTQEQITLHLLYAPVALWTCLIKRTFFNTLELDDCIYNDASFIWKLKLSAKQFCYIPNYIYIQHEHADSVSGSNSKNTNVYHIFKSFAYLKEFMTQLNLPPIWKTYFALYKFRMTIGHCGGPFTPENKEKFLHQLKTELAEEVYLGDIMPMYYDEILVKWYNEVMSL